MVHFFDRHWSLAGPSWSAWPFHKLCNIRRIILEWSKAKSVPLSGCLFPAWTPPTRMWVVWHRILWERADPVSSLRPGGAYHWALITGFLQMPRCPVMLEAATPTNEKCQLLVGRGLRDSLYLGTTCVVSRVLWKQSETGLKIHSTWARINKTFHDVLLKEKLLTLNASKLPISVKKRIRKTHFNKSSATIANTL